ncbi:MAG: threonine/serine dehydratase [Woeseiaceae bacterium]|nr:threonine/serine dehydratase [Woeseiaceae bacterium]
MRFGSDPRSDLLGGEPRPDKAAGAAASQAAIERLPADIALAANRLAGHVRETPLEFSPWFSEKTGANVWLKLENLQLTGSFKLRGAFNKLLTLDEQQREAGCVAASSGNHGAAVAYALRDMGVNGIVFVPEKSSSAKVDAIRRAGAEVRFHGRDGLETETFARRFAREEGMTYLSPYNDLAVIAGQGSCGVEIARQLPTVDALFVAVGGGGLIAGCGSFLKASRPGIEIVSCQPAASAVMTESVRAGRLLELESEPTLSDGTAGGIEPEAVTFDICRRVVDRYEVVDEAAIADAMRQFIDAQHQLIEGAAGVAIAALLQSGEDFRDRNVVVIVCGGNIARDTLRDII